MHAQPQRPPPPAQRQRSLGLPAAALSLLLAAWTSASATGERAREKNTSGWGTASRLRLFRTPLQTRGSTARNARKTTDLDAPRPPARLLPPLTLAKHGSDASPAHRRACAPSGIRGARRRARAHAARARARASCMRPEAEAASFLFVGPPIPVSTISPRGHGGRSTHHLQGATFR
eukprot:353108-Chlamydomonas_euryale.AAC.11